MVDLQGQKANASPTKEFFVNMITRDITLQDSILDLIDNSIDAAWQSAGSHAMTLDDKTDLSAYRIVISLSEKEFAITDNCNGMTLDDAVKYAFSFGRKATQKHDEYSIGVYGIGMKRAVFKLGTDIRIRSTVLDEDGSRLSFAVPINVPTWLADQRASWDFDIVEEDHQEENGVAIRVKKLSPAAVASFGSPAFIENLRRLISRDYSLYLSRGLTIMLNNRPAVGVKLELGQSDEFSPVRLRYNEEQSGKGVLVEILGGMAATPPDSTEPDEKSDGDRTYGWYVACNGRIVLAADKSEVSGWSTPDWPQWHRQYAGFIGIVLFSAQDTDVLPVTTTKRSVDLTSDLYRRSQVRMRDVSKSWIAYTNRRKQALEQAKAKEAVAVSVPIQAIEHRPALVLPALELKKVERPANVHYSVPIGRMKALARAFGSVNLPYREVGIRSFNHAYDDLVGDE